MKITALRVWKNVKKNIKNAYIYSFFRLSVIIECPGFVTGEMLNTKNSFKIKYEYEKYLSRRR